MSGVRLFAGLYPPEEACAHLAAHVSTLHLSAADARPTPRAQWHVTVVFLGEVPDARLPDVQTALKSSSGGTTPVRLRIAGGGRFGTILWAGLSGDVDHVAALGESARRELSRARLPFDDRPFRPHLTLARPGDRLDPRTIEADRAALDTYEGPEWTATHLRLMRSQLGPTPVYTELSRFDL